MRLERSRKKTLRVDALRHWRTSDAPVAQLIVQRQLFGSNYWEVTIPQATCGRGAARALRLGTPPAVESGTLRQRRTRDAPMA